MKDWLKGHGMVLPSMAWQTRDGSREDCTIYGNPVLEEELDDGLPRKVTRLMVDEWQSDDALTLPDNSTSWRAAAACAGRSDLFYATTNHLNSRLEREAISFCEDCPVRQNCLDEWVDEVLDGAPGAWETPVRGGLTGTERRKLIRSIRKGVRSKKTGNQRADVA